MMLGGTAEPAGGVEDGDPGCAAVTADGVAEATTGVGCPGVGVGVDPSLVATTGVG